MNADELTDIEQDALAEIANMGVSRAANSLRQMVGEEVLLSVPAVKIVTRQAASKLVERNNANKLVAVQQSFEGPFAGRALLIFPEAQSLELVRSIVGDEHSLEDVIDLEQEALAETGNIILNGCLATIANVLHRTMRMSLPSIVRGDGAKLFEVNRDELRRTVCPVPVYRFQYQETQRSRLHCATHGSAIDRRPEGHCERFRQWYRKATLRSCWITHPISCSARCLIRSTSASSCSTARAVSSAGMNGWPAFRAAPARDVLGKALFEVFPEVRHTRLPDVIDDSFRAGSSSILTHTLNALLPLQGENGEPLLHNIVVRPVSSVHANYCLLQITDVTVAVTRERVLRERQNARYHAIVDSAPDAIVTIDDNRNIQWVNGAVDHVLGL